MITNLSVRPSRSFLEVSDVFMCVLFFRVGFIDRISYLLRQVLFILLLVKGVLV